MKGFTLLEVMIAMAILAVALLVLSRAQGDGILVSQYEEQQITAATLAKVEMVNIQIKILKDGFPDSDLTDNCGKFSEDLDDKNFDGWEYCWTMKKVNIPLPMNMIPGQGGAGDASGSSDPTSAGGAGGALPGGIDPKNAADALSKAIRVVRLTIKWKLGNNAQQMDVVTHMVNFSQVQL